MSTFKLNPAASAFEAKPKLNPKAPEFQSQSSNSPPNSQSINWIHDQKGAAPVNSSASNPPIYVNNMFDVLSSVESSINHSSPISNGKKSKKDLKKAKKQSAEKVDKEKKPKRIRPLFQHVPRPFNEPVHDHHLNAKIIKNNLLIDQTVRFSIDAPVLKSRLYQGVLRVYKDRAFVSVDEFDRDVLIATRADRNRAFDGDVVAVKLTGAVVDKEDDIIDALAETLVEADTDVNAALADEDLASRLAETSIAATQYAGIVVGIIESNHPTEVVGTLRSPGPHFCLFEPFDRRFPFAQCFVDDWPAELVEQARREHDRGPPVVRNNQIDGQKSIDRSPSPATIVDNIYLMRYAEWGQDDRFPRCHLVRRLGKAGTLDGEVSAALFAWGADAVFSDKLAPECAKFMDFKITDADRAERRDLRHLRVFSIDPATARDLDDAISIEKIDKKRFRIGVHIADVSHFVRPGSLVDAEAWRRATSLYLPDRVVPMLPRLLSEHACSLNLGVERLTYSVFFDLNEKGELIDDQGWMGRSIIQTVARFDYGHVQQIINQQGILKKEQRDAIESKCLMPGKQLMLDEIVPDLLLLHSLTRQRRHARFEAGSLSLTALRLRVDVDQTSKLPVNLSCDETDDAHILIEELMLYTNVIVARTLIRYVRSRALLRQQSGPKPEFMARVRDLLAEQGFDISIESSGDIYRSMMQLDADNRTLGDKSMPVPARIVLEPMLTRSMRLATFICSNAKVDPWAVLDEDDEMMTHDNWHHYSLNFPHYTQFTSPIRSYSNLAVHRLLDEALEWRDWASMPDFALRPTTVLSVEKVAKVAKQCNERRAEARRIQDQVTRLYFISFLNSKFTTNVVSEDARPNVWLDASANVWLDASGRPPMIEIAVILAVGASLVDIRIPRLGLECQVGARDVAHCRDAKIVGTGKPIRRTLEVQWSDREVTMYRAFDCIVVQLIAVTSPRLDFSATVLDARSFAQFATKVSYIDQAGADI